MHRQENFLFAAALALLVLAGDACAGSLDPDRALAQLHRSSSVTSRSENNAAIVQLNKLPYFYGREYFVLRSGRAQLIAQADRVDLGPAFTYLLFDAQNPRQSVSKEGAFNFSSQAGFSSSGLVVELGGFGFTALGQRTTTRWVFRDGVPAVEAIWWAGGVRVTERLSALGGRGIFLRSVRLEGGHLIGAETVRLHLFLPPGENVTCGEVLLGQYRGAMLAVAVGQGQTVEILPQNNELITGPMVISPGKSVAVDTFLAAQIPASKPNGSSGGELFPKMEQWAELVRSVAADMKQERDGAARQWALSSSIRTEDETVQEIYDKARFALPGMIADDGTMDAGIFEYGAQWVRDSSNTALGALHAGHFEVARQALERILNSMISPQGATMIATAFESPDREQFDQMGELLHLLRNYRDWTGDDSLVRRHRERLVAMIERPLLGQFRDATGMVHNRREFWERTFDDAYELAYQTYVILGLREAAELAESLGSADRAPRWRAEADRMEKAMLSQPKRALVQEGRLIKRRNVGGDVTDLLQNFKGYLPDVPLNTETHHRLAPDASMALPIALRIVDPHSALARNTLDQLEELWNTRWSDGGYDRYHTSSQPDQPGPWPFATTFILRAQHEAELFERSRRSLEWLNTHQGGRAGAFFEEIPSNRSQAKQCGIVCWTSGEVALFVVRHYLGIDFEQGQLVLRPKLYPKSPPIRADLRFRQDRLRLRITGSGAIRKATINGALAALDRDGALRLPRNFSGGSIEIETTAGTLK